MVSIGEALLNERGDRVEAGGLAVAFAAAAMRVAKAADPASPLAAAAGWAVSRIGQDQAGDELLRQARAMGINVDLVQTDPDLPTARLITRSIAGRVSATLSGNSAFDNLQWDFDMIDLAQRADAVVFGQLARRGGQTKSVIKQFLLECSGGGGGGGVGGGGGGGNALRVFDLTNRAADKLDRGDAVSGLEFCDVLVSDEIGLKAFASFTGGDGDVAVAAAREVLRASKVQVVVIVTKQNGGERLRAIARDQFAESNAMVTHAQHEEAIVRVVHGLLDGHDLAQCLQDAAR